ncbi:MAG: DUF362 domain-containing protein [Spirochaetes bacterium]|nr:DUF362 domain-containing protein [Spirochaetota bacterium]
MSKVYFTDLRTGSKGNIYSKIRALFERAEFAKLISKNEFVAIKTHFGEYGNIAFIPAQVIRVFVDIVNALGGKPFVTDTNTLYRGSRSNAIDHLKNASLHGFTMECVGAPVIIADGLNGNDYRVIPYKGKHYGELKIASAIYEAHSVIMVSHVKGHELYGFGGALKNVAMGCVPPSGKQTIHSEFKPKVKESECQSCGKCIVKCPADAIVFNANKKAQINQNICIGCGECIVVCPYAAIPVVWKTSAKPLHERTAEYIKGIMDTKPHKWIFFNFMINISPDCDCFPWNDAPVVQNIGIAASHDPVALDKACADMINNATILEGSRHFEYKGEQNVINKIAGSKDWQYLFECCEKEGIGVRDYELISL